MHARKKQKHHHIMTQHGRGITRKNKSNKIVLSLILFVVIKKVNNEQTKAQGSCQ